MSRQAPVEDLLDGRVVVSGSGRGGVVRIPAVAASRSDRPSDEFVNLNFKVPVGVRKRFRLLAADADLKNVEMLMYLLDHYERSHAVVS